MPMSIQEARRLIGTGGRRRSTYDWQAPGGTGGRMASPQMQDADGDGLPDVNYPGGGTPGGGGTTPTTTDPNVPKPRTTGTSNPDLGGVVGGLGAGMMDLPKWQFEMLFGEGSPYTTPGGTPRTGRTTFDTGPGYLNLAERGFASDEEQRRINNAIMWQELLNSQKYADRNFDLDRTQADRGELGNRAGMGLNVAEFARQLALDRRNDALDPGNFPALLQGYAGLEPTSGPLTDLLGQGFKIDPVGGSNPLADPRFQQNLGNLYDYAGAMNTDFDAVRRAYDTNPNAAEGFANFARFDAARTPVALATGGVIRTGEPQYPTPGMPTPTSLAPLGGFRSMAGGGGGAMSLPSGWGDRLMAQRNRFAASPNVPSVGSIWAARSGAQVSTPNPVTINDMATQRPLAVAGEAGQEDINVTPAGRGLTPSEGTFVALAKALRPLGYPPEFIQAIASGSAPGAPLFNPQLQERLIERNPSLYRMALAGLRSRVGSAGLDDLLAEAERFRMRGGSVGNVIR